MHRVDQSGQVQMSATSDTRVLWLPVTVRGMAALAPGAAFGGLRPGAAPSRRQSQAPRSAAVLLRPARSDLVTWQSDPRPARRPADWDLPRSTRSGAAAHPAWPACTPSRTARHTCSAIWASVQDRSAYPTAAPDCRYGKAGDPGFSSARSSAAVTALARSSCRSCWSGSRSTSRSRGALSVAGPPQWLRAVSAFVLAVGVVGAADPDVVGTCCPFSLNLVRGRRAGRALTC